MLLPTHPLLLLQPSGPSPIALWTDETFCCVIQHYLVEIAIVWEPATRGIGQPFSHLLIKTELVILCTWTGRSDVATRFNHSVANEAKMAKFTGKSTPSCWTNPTTHHVSLFIQSSVNSFRLCECVCVLIFCATQAVDSCSWHIDEGLWTRWVASSLNRLLTLLVIELWFRNY